MDEIPDGNLTAAYTFDGFPEEMLQNAFRDGMIPGSSFYGRVVKGRFVLVDWLGITGSGRISRLPDGKWQAELLLSTKWADPDTVLMHPDGVTRPQDVLRVVSLDIHEFGVNIVMSGRMPAPPGHIDFAMTLDRDDNAQPESEISS